MDSRQVGNHCSGVSGVNTCKTCRWWGNPEYKNGGVVLTGDFRTCGSPKIVYGYHEDLPALDGAAAENDEGWGFTPGPDFGCIHHESIGESQFAANVARMLKSARDSRSQPR